MPILRHAQKRPKPVSALAGSRSHFDEKNNPSTRKTPLCRRKSKFPPAQPHERAREGRNPLAPRHPRGCRGAERPTLAPPEMKSSFEQPFASSGASISTEAVSCIVGNRNSRRSSPRESARGSQPSRIPSPRGCRGAERPTLAPSETKSSSEQPFASSKTRISTEAVSRIVGNPNSRRTSPLRRRKPASPPKHFPASSETEIPAEAVPGRAREGCDPLAPRHPRGCRGAERPTPAPSETASSKGQPASSGTNSPTRTAPGERERV